MPPLTSSSPSICDTCAGLSQKVADLERQMSSLFKIHEQRDLDVILGRTHATATSAQLADTARFSRGTPESRPSSPAQARADPEEQRWLQQGARPKAPVTTTPLRSDQWTVVGPRGGRSLGGRRSDSHTGCLHLMNKFDVLDLNDFPPLTSSPSRREEQLGPTRPERSPLGQSCAKQRRANLLFTPAPKKHGMGSGSPPALGLLHESEFPLLSKGPVTASTPTPPRDAVAVPVRTHSSVGSVSGDAAARSRRTQSQNTRRESGAPSGTPVFTSGLFARGETGGGVAAPVSAAGPHARRGRRDFPAPAHASTAARASPCPSVLIVGSSMVRHVRVTNAHTDCYPGALVRDLDISAPRLLRHFSPVSTVVVHVGTNDLRFQQSEKLNADFISLIKTIQSMDKQCVISGPFPPPRFGDIKFSRICQLHLWLKGYCTDNNIPYVDNFMTFYKRPELFKKD